MRGRGIRGVLGGGMGHDGPTLRVADETGGLLCLAFCYAPVGCTRPAAVRPKREVVGVLRVGPQHWWVGCRYAALAGGRRQPRGGVEWMIQAGGVRLTRSIYRDVGGSGARRGAIGTRSRSQPEWATSRRAHD